MSDVSVLRERTVSPGDVEFPDPVPGTATVVRSQREQLAVVLHPADYAWLTEDRRLIGSLWQLESLVDADADPPATAGQGRSSAPEELVLGGYAALVAWLELDSE